jgi:hypothetical protein
VVMGRYRSGSMGSESSHRTPELASAPSSLKQQSHGDGSWSPGALYVGTDDNISFNQRMGNCIFICGFNMQPVTVYSDKCSALKSRNSSPSTAPAPHHRISPTARPINGQCSLCIAKGSAT